MTLNERAEYANEDPMSPSPFDTEGGHGIMTPKVKIQGLLLQYCYILLIKKYFWKDYQSNML